MEHFRPKLILQCIILFEFLAATVQGIKCNPVPPESYNAWPTNFSGSANLFHFIPNSAVDKVCVTFRGIRVQNVLQMEFNCDDDIRYRLESILAEFGKHDAYGVRHWKPLLVEACTGAANQDHLGPVGFEQNSLIEFCTHHTPSPNCSYRVDIPIAFNSYFVYLGNNTTPYTTWYDTNKGVRPVMFVMRTLKAYRNDAEVSRPEYKLWIILTLLVALGKIK